MTATRPITTDRSPPARALRLGVVACVLSLLAACEGGKLEPRPVLVDPVTKTETVSTAPAGEPVIEHPTAETPDGAKLPVLHTIKMDTGVVIEDLRMGEGADCMPASIVVVRYHGTLPDGTVFDTTRGQERPAEFPLDKLIRGWREGLPGMKVGGIRRLTIPAGMAYGEKGKGKIPPNSEIFFSIELVDVKSALPASEGGPAMIR